MSAADIPAPTERLVAAQAAVRKRWLKSRYGLVGPALLIIGVFGYALGLGLTQLARHLLDNLSIPIQVQSRGDILLWSCGGTLLFCVLASVLPAVKIIRTDPEVVFRS